MAEHKNSLTKSIKLHSIRDSVAHDERESLPTTESEIMRHKSVACGFDSKPYDHRLDKRKSCNC